MNHNVDFFFSKTQQKWHQEFDRLRMIILDCGLTEELKWGKPCYTFNKGNIVLMHGFKKYCALLFLKGALLKDSKGILIQQTENVQSARQIRFTNVQEIIKGERTIKLYIKEAIVIEKAGLLINFKKTENFLIPDEFQKQINVNPELKTAFDSLTPGRQRGYILYFSAPKQSQTREKRIEKYIKHILMGKGLNDE